VPGKTTVEIEIHSLRACILTLHGDHDAELLEASEQLRRRDWSLEKTGAWRATRA